MKAASIKATFAARASVIGGLLLCASIARAATWKIETVDQSGAGISSSLKVDRFGNAHLVYVVDDGNKYPMRYAIWDHTSKKWFAMTIAESVGSCTMVLDSKQNPHISYVDFGTGSGSKLHYMYWDGTDWKRIAIPLNSDVISYFSSLVLDSSDKPSITFYEYRGSKETDFRIRLRNVTLKEGVWQVKTIDGEEGSGKFNSMAIDPLGHMHISYANVGAVAAGARYAYWDGRNWKTEIVDGMAENNGLMVGFSSCIALDRNNDPHISYVNEAQPALKYAVRKNGHWQVQVITRMVGVGYPDRNSIALDEDGRPYISYYDPGRGTLYLTHPENKGWVIETVEAGGVGFNSSLQIVDGEVWISYADQTNSAIKVARMDLNATRASTSSIKTPSVSGVAK